MANTPAMHSKQDANNDMVVLNSLVGVLPRAAGKDLGSGGLCGGQSISLHLSNKQNISLYTVLLLLEKGKRDCDPKAS